MGFGATTNVWNLLLKLIPEDKFIEFGNKAADPLKD